MLEEVLMHLHNWFVVQDGIHAGKYSIEDGSITLPFLVRGQYFRIVGSVLNDGLHQYPADDLVDENFDGAVWALAVPPALVKLSQEIEKWAEKNPVTPYTSESFGGYSYSKASGANGQPLTWKDAFRSRLNPYRKVRDTVPVSGQQPVHPYHKPFSPDYPWRW